MALTAPTPRLDVRRPFTRADALAAGISPKMLRGSRFRRIFRGVYIDARVPDRPEIRIAAALMLHPPEAFASHYSAARLYGVPVPAHSLEHITVWDPDRRVYRVGLQPHATQYPTEDDVQVVRGMRVSRPCRMFVELASVLGLVDLVVVGEALIRMRLASRADIVSYCNASPAQHAGDARRAAEFVRDRVESPMETRLRMLIVLAGLPEPEVNWIVVDEDGVVRYRLDLAYPALKLAVEYDGRQHVEDVAQWKRDLQRREWLDVAGWRIIVVTAEGLFGDPAGVVERVRNALADRGHYIAKPLLREEWRPHFRGRREGR